MDEKTKADIYDEEFFNNLQMAKTLISQIRSRRDKEICKKWIQKLCGLKSDDAVVKKNRNSFFKYMLQIVNKAAQKDSLSPQYDKKGNEDDELHFMSKWSADNRTYIAVKPLPGQGALVYMAVSSDPKLGWNHQ
ncbi:unnamed protein product [Phaedon cochleariae]|uniref:DUF4485 domain-containing protein n=1 Tax=Phaedon cochleariae TaxID=80249 RepID=A0A9P0GLV3_PHACE|nr:unnamed protein product [Phaedon cochleariae]